MESRKLVFGCQWFHKMLGEFLSNGTGGLSIRAQLYGVNFSGSGSGGSSMQKAAKLDYAVNCIFSNVVYMS